MQLRCLCVLHGRICSYPPIAGVCPLSSPATPCFDTLVLLPPCCLNAAADTHAHIVAMEPSGQLGMSEGTIAINSMLPPVDAVSILCIGLNYKKHAAETKSQLPKYPGVCLWVECKWHRYTNVA